MRLLCILLVEYRADVGCQPELDQGTIETVSKATSYHNSEIEAKQGLATMIERGGYYLNLEKHVGQGVCFVLGTSLSETYWTKLITKSGPKFNMVLERFNEISLPETAAQYAALRQRVIGAKLESFRNQRNSLILGYPPFSQNAFYQFGYQTGSDVNYHYTVGSNQFS